jgi:D-alanyl-D-alanine carboxypeptidase
MSRPLTLFIFISLLVCVFAYVHRDEFSKQQHVVERAEYVVLDDAFKNVRVSAASYLVFDVETGREFGTRTPSTPREVASVVKLLTADAALSGSNIDASTTVSWRAVATSGKTGHLTAGEEYRMRELVFPLLLESSNDAAEAIAEVGGRAAFVASMNARAREIGMASTTVVDPTGLSRGNVSTAYDLQKLLTHLYTNHRHVLDITTLRSYVGERHIWRNNDPVISSEGFLGGKHGYTETAGRTIALIFKATFYGSEEPRAVGIILLESEALEADVAALKEELMRAVRVGYPTPLVLPST